MPLDDVIEDMKLNDVQVVAVRQSLNAGQRETQQYPAFEIRFAYSERFMAQKVTTDLVARFLEENVREVSQQTVSTTQFLQDRWEESKKKLDELEQRLSVFRGAKHRPFAGGAAEQLPAAHGDAGAEAESEHVHESRESGAAAV